MTNTSMVPRLAYVTAVFFSLLLMASIILAFLQTGPSLLTTYIVPPFVCSLAALLFALWWPLGSWRWGVVLSSGSWSFFVVVFLSYLSLGQLDWLSAVRAISVLLAGMVGSMLGTSFRYSGGQN